ncbi:MAG TPA: DNA repair protein RecO [Myxococcota bacterium]|nr:DNA repair protein RecO [Myxococcota bacterium]
MSRRSRAEAIVLNRSALGESDWIVTLLSRDHGKFRAVAPGARRSKRRFAGCLELFSLIDARFVEKANGLHRLEEAVLLDSHEPITKDLVSIAHAGYAVELAGAFLGEADEAAGFFDLLTGTLTRLKAGPLSAKEIRSYELGILGLAGFAPRFSSCLGCGTHQAIKWVFDHVQGALFCVDCATGRQLQEISPAVLGLLNALQTGREPDQTIDAQSMATARGLLAGIIDSHTSRPLKAREFLRKLAGTE